jgi:diaminopimelate epimerase
VNFVSPPAAGSDGVWRTRTYERGVEGETLACGSGAVAAAVLLTAWGLAEPPVRLATRSGRVLEVRLARTSQGWLPSLSGEARIVYRGELAEF